MLFTSYLYFASSLTFFPSNVVSMGLTVVCVCLGFFWGFFFVFKSVDVAHIPTILCGGWLADCGVFCLFFNQ